KQTAGPAAPPPVNAVEDKAASAGTDLLGTPLPEGAVARLGSSRLRIGNSAFALTPDGRTIVTVAPQAIVRQFDANTGGLLERRQLTDRPDAAPSGQARAQLSTDGKTVAIDDRSGNGRRVTVWDVVSGRMIFRRAPAAGVGGPGLSPDGKQLALYE